MIIGVCRYCLGCNRLEDNSFNGTYNCENYIGETKDYEFKKQTDKG